MLIQWRKVLSLAAARRGAGGRGAHSGQSACAAQQVAPSSAPAQRDRAGAAAGRPSSTAGPLTEEGLGLRAAEVLVLGHRRCSALRRVIGPSALLAGARVWRCGSARAAAAALGCAAAAVGGGAALRACARGRGREGAAAGVGAVAHSRDGAHELAPARYRMWSLAAGRDLAGWLACDTGAALRAAQRCALLCVRAPWRFAAACACPGPGAGCTRLASCSCTLPDANRERGVEVGGVPAASAPARTRLPPHGSCCAARPAAHTPLPKQAPALSGAPARR
jgi:hypothetical protein